MKRRLPLHVVAQITFPVLFTVVVSLLTSAGATYLPQLLKDYALPLVSVFAIAYVMSVIAWHLFQSQSPQPRQPHAPNLEAETRARRWLLDLVRADCTDRLKKARNLWIPDPAKPSWRRAKLIELLFKERPDAVDNPWVGVSQASTESGTRLESGISIIDVFNQAGKELLILGEPGSGKTILMHQLIEYLLPDETGWLGWLIDRVPTHLAGPQDLRHNVHNWMPARFQLSTWTAKRLSIADWLVEELHERYRIEAEIGGSWIAANLIVPLLDGLEWVSPEHRTSCIDAINDYRQAHGSVPIVVCSGSKEYSALNRRLKLRKAVAIEHLTEPQRADYMKAVGRPLDGMRSALQQNKELVALAETPLMLTTLAQAYYGKSAEDLPELRDPDERLRIVFKNYVQCLFEPYPPGAPYSLKKSEPWLSWIARHSQPEPFYLEQIQPSWLSRKWSLRLYDFLAMTLPCGLFLGFAGWLAAQLVGLVPGMVTGIALGALNSVVGLSNTSSKQSKPIIRVVTKVFVFGVLGALIFAASDMAVRLISGATSLDVPGIKSATLTDLVLSDGIIFGVLAAVFGGLVDRLIHGSDLTERPVEPLEWSWGRAAQTFLTFLISGLGSGLILGLALTLARQPLAGIPRLVILGGVLGLLFGLFFALFRGWSSTQPTARAGPNERIRNSARNMLRVGTVNGIVFGMIAGLTLGWLDHFAGLPFAADIGLVFGLIFGLFGGFASGLFKGGDVCVRYSLVRMLLWREGSLPRNPRRFLDFACERGLLSQEPGGYRFRHEFLRDYFARAVGMMIRPTRGSLHV